MLELDLVDVNVSFVGLPTPVLAIDRLTVSAGSRVAITGASGSGKSTLVNIITGLERCPSGRVSWGGTDLAKLTQNACDRWRAGNVGLVMQDFHLFPGLSALDNILLPVRLARAFAHRHHVQAMALLERVGLARPVQKIETMSRGEMQRVALARALLRSPGVLVADEPTASLDSESASAVGSLILEMAAENATTLIVTSHDPQLIDRLDRHIALKGGRVVSDETRWKAAS